MSQLKISHKCANVTLLQRVSCVGTRVRPWAKAIGDVIRNPEIQALSTYLLGAIAKPAELTLPCLDVLLETTFVNTVDAPPGAHRAGAVPGGARPQGGPEDKGGEDRGQHVRARGGRQGHFAVRGRAVQVASIKTHVESAYGISA